MDRNHIDKIASTGEDKILLAKVWDKITNGISRNIPAHTGFLSPRELHMTKFLFGDISGLCHFGGYEDAERTMLCYLPEYIEQSTLMGEDSPIACLRATYYEADTLSHRDFLGALMGAGIAREAIGDICVGCGTCDFFVTRAIIPYLLQNFTQAGRTKLKLEMIPLSSANIPEVQVQVIKDTVASLRLDSVISSGFRIARCNASQAITAGKVNINGLPAEKPDKLVAEGCKIALRGSGKIKLEKVCGQTKKGRISVEIHRYL